MPFRDLLVFLVFCPTLDVQLKDCVAPQLALQLKERLLELWLLTMTQWTSVAIKLPAQHHADGQLSHTYRLLSHLEGMPCFLPYVNTFPSKSGPTKSQATAVTQLKTVSTNQLFRGEPAKATALMA